MTQTAVFLPGAGTMVPTIDMTATVQTATAAANTQATATSAAATAAAQGDSDGDGLSNAQEGLIGTDPNNPDTDADQLTDGQEVLIYVTDPLNRDTDMDSFSDGQEVLVLGSDPLNPFDPVNPGPMPTRPMPPGPMPTKPMPPGPMPTQPGPPTRTPGPPPVTLTFTPLPTFTVTPSVTPPPPNTPVPTPTNTPVPPTFTPTVTYTPEPPPTSVTLVCGPAPVIDGIFNPSNWPAVPFAQFSAASNPARRVEIYAVKNGGNLYFAYLMNDPVADPSDQLRVQFDTLGNQGDPDAPDRLLMVNRDGAWEVWAGIGSNSDIQLWDSTYSSGNWTVASSDSGSQWIAEIQINTAAEMPGLADPFGMMSQVNFVTALATWPTGADGNNASTWQAVGNPSCP